MGLFVSKVQGQDNAWRCPPCQKIYPSRAEAYACCSDRKRPLIRARMSTRHLPRKMKELKNLSIEDIRVHFARMESVDPIAAKTFAKDMEAIEGKEFKNKVLGEFAGMPKTIKNDIGEIMKKRKQLLRELQKDAIISLQKEGFTNSEIARVLYMSDRNVYRMLKEESGESVATEVEKVKTLRKREIKPDCPDCCTGWEWGFGRTMPDKLLEKAVKDGYMSSRCAEYIVKSRK